MEATSKKRLILEQRKAKLSLEEQKLHLQERKLRTRRLIELGGLVVKAELDQLNNNTLLGAFLSLKHESAQIDKVNLWTEQGATAFKKSKSNHTQEEKVPLVITFVSEPTHETKSHLRDLKFKWNPFRKEWYGYGLESELNNLVRECGGAVERC